MRRFPVTAVAIAVTLVALGTPHPVAAASGPKVVIVVGATGSTTSSYISDANDAAATFGKYTSNIVKVYSPHATWAAVSAAAEGANVIVYLGHGSGWPNPYASHHQTGAPGDNGMGLNQYDSTSNNSNTYYYGEDYMARLGLAPNALVLLWHLCYASGDNEWGKGLPTLSTAKQRVDGYASGFIRGGASAVIAEGVGDISPYIDMVFGGSSTRTIDSIWKGAPNFHNHLTSWSSYHMDGTTQRYAGQVSQIDPDIDHPAADGDYYYRSMVARTSTTAAQIIGGALNPNVNRWYGADRYATAVAVSQKAFTTPGVPVAFVAVGDNFPDALAGAAAAGTLGGPVLLVTANSVPSSTATELTRLKPARIVILGSEAVIYPSVAKTLDAYTTGSVDRWSGTDRYETAAKVSASTFKPGVPTAFVAVGTNYPDALAGAAAAAHLNGPVLLVTADGVPAVTGAELTRLKPARIVILGASAVVSDNVALALKAFTTGAVERWSGTDRYGTAASISSHTFSTPGVPYVFIAVGTNFPDALAGAAGAAKLRGPVLLVSPTSIPAAVAKELTRLKPAKIVVLGSPSIISTPVLYQLANYVPSA